MKRILSFYRYTSRLYNGSYEPSPYRRKAKNDKIDSEKIALEIDDIKRFPSTSCS